MFCAYMTATRPPSMKPTTGYRNTNPVHHATLLGHPLLTTSTQTKTMSTIQFFFYCYSLILISIFMGIHTHHVYLYKYIYTP